MRIYYTIKKSITIEGEEKHIGFQAACDGNIQLLSMLILDGHCSVNQQDGRGSTLAHKGILYSSILDITFVNSIR